MPKCRSCNAPIFFLAPEPNRWESNPKSLPINVDPDPAGNIAIYEKPNPRSNWKAEREFKGERRRLMRKLGGEALAAYIRGGGAVYRVHFDTCAARQGRRRSG